MKKRPQMRTSRMVILAAILMLLPGCKKKSEEHVIIITPSITTTAVTSIKTSTAVSGGSITSDGGAGVTARGVCWSSENQNPEITGNKTMNGTGSGTFVSNLTGLAEKTVYYVRAYATNSAGTAYGTVLSFTTTASPSVLTGDYTNILLSTADFSGNVTDEGGSPVTKRGFCFSRINQNPTTLDNTVEFGTGIGAYSGTVKGLIGQSINYVRAFATNQHGTGYGLVVSVKTMDTTISDIDDNHYRIVQIGSQIWMAENLKTTRYRNGDPIPQVTDNNTWDALTTGAYCHYNNNEGNVAVYGGLYNWHAVNDSRSIAPSGWHVPSDAEWSTLTGYFGGDMVAGSKLKEAGSTHWVDPYEPATDEAGFTALPGGGRLYPGIFLLFGYNGLWWTSTQEEGTNGAWSRSMGSLSNGVGRVIDHKQYGYSIRCVRDL